MTLAHYPRVVLLDGGSDICYVRGVVVQVPAVQDPRETSRNRNGDTRAGCGFFMSVRSCAAAFFQFPVRRIMPWPAVPSNGSTSKKGLGSSRRTMAQMSLSTTQRLKKRASSL